ncbi:MAG: WecB/TagA/CpsF family glycosyltransferase [Spirochaetaceae bacterium]|nr:WecB/TagA/CpsF family glycosyltransferase [Spirochaetaceae bacterium]
MDSKGKPISDQTDEPFRERIELLKVPVDIVKPENLQRVVFELLEHKTPENIVLLSTRDLLRARLKGEFGDYVKNAALVIPISKSVVNGASFLTGKTPARYMPFNFVVSLLTMLEQREFSIYLLGGKSAVLAQTEKNIKQTFPRLQVIGRFPCPIKKYAEQTLTQSIRKSSPSLLLVGEGVHGGERWIAKNSTRLNSGLRLWCSDIYSVFAKRRHHPSKAVFDRGLEWVGYCVKNPLRIFRLFPLIYYAFLLLFYKIFKKNQSGPAFKGDGQEKS